MVAIIGLFSSNLFAQDEDTPYFEYKDFTTPTTASPNPHPFTFTKLVNPWDKQPQIRSKNP